jgi:hypothetical protein
VSPEDFDTCEDNIQKENAIYGVLRHLADKRGLYTLERIVGEDCWMANA